MFQSLRSTSASSENFVSLNTKTTNMAAPNYTYQHTHTHSKCKKNLFSGHTHKKKSFMTGNTHTHTHTIIDKHTNMKKAS